MQRLMLFVSTEVSTKIKTAGVIKDLIKIKKSVY